MEIKDKELLEYLRWNSYLSIRFKLLYVATPKVACTALKWWFAALEGYSKILTDETDSAESSPELVIHDVFHKFAPNVTGLTPETISKYLNSSEYFRFAVVRNPYKRIFSAWQSKLLLREPLQIGPYLNCDFFHLPVNNVFDINQAFEGFLEHLASREVPHFWDAHWTPQATLLRPDLVPYTKLVQIENVLELRSALAQHLGPDIPDPFTVRSMNESLIPYLPEFISKRSAELIRILYAQDFSIFGYDLQKPAAKDKFTTEQLNLALKSIGLIRGRHQRLTEIRNEYAGRIANLSKSVVDSESEIVRLNQRITTLKKTVLARESAVSEYKERISELNQIIASGEFEEIEVQNKISTLDQHVAERDLQIAKLHQELNQLKCNKIIKTLDFGIRMFKKIPGVDHALTRKRSSREKRYFLLQREKIETSGMFDKNYYLALNRSVKNNGQDPITHFLTEGASRGCRPNPCFDPAFYLKTYPDIAASGINPLFHYILAGRQEGRTTQALLPSTLKDNRVKERYTSREVAIFFCFGSPGEKRVGDFFLILDWFFEHTALDIRVVLLGVWEEKSLELCFPFLIINPLSISPTSFYDRIFQFAGNNIKALYFNEVAGLEMVRKIIGDEIVSVCKFDSQYDNLTAIENSKENVKYLAISTADTSCLNENYPETTITIVHDTHTCLNGVSSSELNEFSEKLLLYLREAGLKPAVSVIIPNYNHSRYLTERLESVFSQTFRDFEVLLLDDASIDNSLEILEKYAKRYPLTTRLFFNNLNSGSVFKQWKKGVENAQSEILWIAESDDCSSNEFLQKMLPTMNDSRVMISYCQSYCMGGEKNEAMTYVDMGYYDFLGRDRWLRDFTVKSCSEITEHLAVYNTIPNVSSALLRNCSIDVILEEAQRFTVAGDWYFYIRHAEGGRIAYLAQPLNYHRCHRNSVVSTNRNDILFNEFKRMHSLIANRYHLSSETKEKMRTYVECFVWPGLGQKQQHKFEELYSVDFLADVEPGKGKFVVGRNFPVVETDTKPIAFYLPQFHAIPENDKWWGKGFTEWTNTKRGKPLYIGHYQPREPHQDIGYYDLSNWQVLEKQVKLAKQYGIYGFCFYHYWFDGKRLLEKPVDQYLEHPEIEFPFCLCWANENWTRCWDGLNKDILKAQNHSPEDDLAFIKDLSRYLRDYRYIRIEGKPLVIIYRPELLPAPLDSVKLWRDWCLDNGIGEIYLAYMQGFSNPEIPQDIGFDAKIEFPPLVSYNEDIITSPTGLDREFKGLTLSYPAYVRQVILQRKIKQHNFPIFRSVMMAWDNTARRKERATIFTDFSLQAFSDWLADTVKHARLEPVNNRFFFINAWNEWAEGTYLEPDRRYGYSCLETVKTAIELGSNSTSQQAVKEGVVYVCHDAHLHGAQMLSLNIVRKMKEHFGLKVYLILLKGGELEEHFAKYATVFNLSQERFSEKDRRELFLELKTLGVSVAYCSTVVSGCIVEVLKNVGFEVVTLIHELSSIIRSYGLEKEAQNIAQFSDMIVFPSRNVLRSFNSSFPVDEFKCAIQPQGVFLDNPYKNNRSVAKEKVLSLLTLPEESKIVLAIGYADLRKGVDLFVRVAEKVLKSTENVFFVWVGKRERELAMWLQHDISRYGLEEKILFVDATHDITHFYSAADVFVLPSREDPFPIVLLDAMAAGTPVVAFKDAGGFEDIIDGTNGSLVPYLDTKAMAVKIYELLSNEKAACDMGQKGQAMIEMRFNFTDYVNYLLSLQRERNLKKLAIKTKHEDMVYC